MSFSNIQRELTKIDNSKEMTQAVELGVFYVDAIECFCGYSIGALTGDIKVPALFPTLEEAVSYNREMSELYQMDIEAGERESDDKWEGEVMLCRWDFISDEMELCELSGNIVHREDWKSLSGIA